MGAVANNCKNIARGRQSLGRHRALSAGRPWSPISCTPLVLSYKGSEEGSKLAP